MNAIHSKSAFLYTQVRRALQAGHYVPGQRIDPGTIATEFNTSPTPVRFALYRLVGEGLVADHARDGLYVPLPTEVALRDLYDWMQHLLLMSCEVGFVPQALSAVRHVEVSCPEDDLVKLTWQLFDAIAQATARGQLQLAVKRANDRLAPIRRATHDLLEKPFEELSTMARLWQARDIPTLKAALHDYHERRRQLVPCIVARLNARAECLH